MATSCLFGIFVFAPDYTLTYRFLTDDLFTYLYQRFLERDYRFEGHNDVRIFFFRLYFFIIVKLKETDEVTFSIDDTIVQHMGPLLQVFVQTCSRNSPLKRITLESNIQVFFDQVFL